MKKVLFCLVLLLPLAMLTSCNQDDIVRKLAPAEDQAFAEKSLDQLRHKQFEELEKRMDASIQQPNLRGGLEKMSALLPPEEPSKVSLLSTRQNHSSGQAMSNLTYEYTYPKQWFILEVTLNKSHDQPSILGIRITPQSAQIEEQNSFSLVGKSLLQYLILALAVAFAIVTIVALIICIKMKLRRRKWPWMLFILFGFGNLAVNWSTGEFGFAMLAIQMFSASASAVPHGPWILSISLPLGAVCFLIFRKNHAAEVNMPAEAQIDPI
jgi:hypothetical protein